MDKTKLSKLISRSPITTSTIASTASRTEKERILREFVLDVHKWINGEIILIAIKNGSN